MNIINEMFPNFEGQSANKKIAAKIKQIDDNPLVIPEDSTIPLLQEEYERASKIKDKLEDKAKSTIFAITIAATLIMGASNIVGELLNNPLNGWLPGLASIIFFWSFIYDSGW